MVISDRVKHAEQNVYLVEVLVSAELLQLSANIFFIELSAEIRYFEMKKTRFHFSHFS